MSGTTDAAKRGFRRIIIEAVSSAQQRYDTTGDWYFSETGDLIIRVSKLSPDSFHDDATFLVALHELIEARLCYKRGITQDVVDTFDIYYAGDHEEPGDDPFSPYCREHRFAMLIEHLMAHELGVAGYGKVE